jgi:hypothetical protein
VNTYTKTLRLSYFPLRQEKCCGFSKEKLAAMEVMVLGEKN